MLFSEIRVKLFENAQARNCFVKFAIAPCIRKISERPTKQQEIQKRISLELMTRTIKKSNIFEEKYWKKESLQTELTNKC